MTAHSMQKNLDQQPALPLRYDGRSPDYLDWRKQRLARQQHIPVHLQNGIRISPTLNTQADCTALALLCNAVQDFGFCLYQWTTTPDNLQQSISRLNHCLQLSSADAGVITNSDELSLLEDLPGTEKGRFIPYTSRAMNWHTDGYYNTRAESVRCFTLHCIQPAQGGGELTLMDTELLLIRLYDKYADSVAMLTHPQAMTIPRNIDTLGHHRPDRTAALLFAHDDGALGTNFTTRSKHIAWRDSDTERAAATAKALIISSTEDHHTLRLASNQGIITRNILHARSAFTDSTANSGNRKRQMLRGRYHQLATLNHQAFATVNNSDRPTRTNTGITEANRHAAR